ncbi:hypothetical protein GQX73_g3871 [Xylaria multiplex]|uniref:Amidase domain-containing protein n=1 Tax=Xylaria multiplex TaxID=323545 RepID=A0A7C8IYY9_9PEZI|nr:hypothetical protein GQX73_g3871 [Xylaria multiplex]
MEIGGLYMFQLDQKEYAIWEEGTAISMSITGHCLVTVIPKLPKSSASSFMGYLKTIIDQALNDDDVFDLRFLSGIFIPSCYEKSVVTPDAKALLSAWGNSWIHTYDYNDGHCTLRPGPCVLRDGILFPAWRIYEDTANAFSLPLRLPKESESFAPMRIGSSHHSSRCVAVPSRMAKFAGESLPLTGLRIAVKDNFDMCGIRTSLGSRHYLHLGQPALKTSPVVQALMDAGANIIGLTQMCSMVLKQEPTQCIDFPAPFNPRGDGYQSPSGGSSGQAAAIASYKWLDAAIGSDSVVCPLLLTDVSLTVRLWVSLHVKGCGQALRKHSLTLHEKLPPYLLFTTDPLGPESSPQKDITIAFLRDVERILGIPAKQFSVSDAWKNNPPAQALGLSISEYLNADVRL